MAWKRIFITPLMRTSQMALCGCSASWEILSLAEKIFTSKGNMNLGWTALHLCHILLSNKYPNTFFSYTKLHALLFEDGN
jgi:hypothetical protein